MIEDMPQVSLVAAVGPGGSLGPKDGLPLFKDPEEGRIYADWFLTICSGGIVLIDKPTVEKMTKAGWTGLPDSDLAIWDGQEPMEVMPALQKWGKPIFVVGSADLYKAFMPFVQQFFVRRVELVGPHETFMPNPFGTMH